MDVPEFVPHPWLWNGHLQTVMGRVNAREPRLPATLHEVEVDGGDRLAVLESIPDDDAWRPGDPAAVLVHGLGGSARSRYVASLGRRLWERGVRVVRINMRGAGEGFGLAKGIYHAGRTEDIRRVAEWLTTRAPGSPMALIGFSLGANLVLKLAAEAADHPLDGLDSVVAANPPIDLEACCRKIQEPANRIYDRSFVKALRADIARLHERFPELGPVNFPKALTLYDFDDLYTAPRNGFRGAADYYARSSAAPRIPSIRVPGLVVHAEDDPFIPAEPFRRTAFPPSLRLELVRSGGHLGYISRERWGGTRRWLDVRLAAWLVDRWALARNAQGEIPRTPDPVEAAPSLP